MPEDEPLDDEDEDEDEEEDDVDQDAIDELSEMMESLVIEDWNAYF